MNATGAAMLKDPSPCGHIVYPYVDPSHFIDAVCLFVETGIQRGDSALLLIEESHLESIRRGLQRNALDPVELEANGRLVFRSAEALLKIFMFDGIIDELKFQASSEEFVGVFEGFSAAVG